MYPVPIAPQCVPQSRDITPAQDLFRGLWIPLITPFHADGRIDHAALRKLVERAADQGVHGFVACGSTGEAAALDSQEQLAVLETVLAHSGRRPVVMGVSGYNLPETIAWIRSICELPVAGVLVPAPHYIRPSQDGLRQWFETLADASAVPVVIYDIPYRTGVSLSIDTLLALAAHPRIAAIKDCAGDIVKTLTLIEDGRLNVLVGDDIQMFATLAQGGHGAIAASAHLHTLRFLDMLRLIDEGGLAQARAHWHALVPMVHMLFAEPNPGPLKALLAAQGDIHGGLRAPMQSASRKLVSALVDSVHAITPT